MSTRLKQWGITLLLHTIRLFGAISRALWWLIRITLKPLVIILKWLVMPLVLVGYTWYLKAITRLKRSAFMQNKVLFIFGNKYFIHVIVMIITLFVASTNLLQAKETPDDIFAQHSALYKIVNPDNEVNNDTVETGLPKKRSIHQGAYIDTRGVMVATVPNLDPTAEPARTIGEQVALANKNTAVVSTNALQTKNGNRSGIIEYKVHQGDTVGTIADRFGLTVTSVLLANNLTSKSYIKPGDTLKILPSNGVLYTVASGDTLDAIISKYKGNLEETIKINDIGSDHTVAVGAQIVIVDGTPPPPPQPAVTSYLASRTNTTTSTYQASNLPAYVTAGQFNYPVGCRGPKTTYWGHAGRGRDLPCAFGTPVYASTDGIATISFTGAWGSGYGNAIDINNGAGTMTRYAHLNAFAISSGQRVSRGQVIGYVGMTGRTSGPHLHFEIHINGVAYDPIYYLK